MKKLASLLGVAIAVCISAQFAGAAQVIDDSLQVNSLKVGQQGVGGVTYFNGTIVNETTGEGGSDNPVTFGDNVRIDGRVYRGATAGAGDTQPFIINDNMEVVGSLVVGSTNVLEAISANEVDLSGYMPYSTFDSAVNGKIDADSLDSGIAATLVGTGVISNTEFGYLNGVSSNIQTQISAKGVGDMLKSTYDVAGNSKIDASKLDSGIAATLIGTGTISNTEFGYLNGVSSNLQTQISAKGVGDMLKSTYDVAGNSKIDAGKLDSGINATLIGGGGVSNTIYNYLVSLNLDNTSDLRLTALGYQAGNAIAATGYRNTFIGYQAGDLVTTGTDNTAIGNDALGATTTTANNTAVGSGALAENTDTNCTAIGYDALTANTTGNGNTALGSEALDANTEGDYNTAIGNDALGSNILASSNTAIGYNAMAAHNGAGAMNVAIGRSALDASTGGTWNVAVGYETLTTGTGNDASVAVGYKALRDATGDNNIGIGYQAGNDISSGGSNIAIGYDADVPTATSSNQLNIGGTIWGDLSNDYIAIGGTAIPTDAWLEINQNASDTVPHIELNPIADTPNVDNDTGDIYMDTDGSLYVYNTVTWAAANAGSDFSELIVPIGFEKEVLNGTRSYKGDINAGDLIVINQDGYYERSSKPNDSTIVGIESGNRGRFRLKEGTLEREEGQRQVGMVGHVLVNVSIENGAIIPGDALTTSSVPGHAMKATFSGMTVGRALEPFDGSQGQNGTIEAMVNPGWYGGAMVCRY